MSTLFGADADNITRPAGSWFGAMPPGAVRQVRRSEPEPPMVKWARRCFSQLKRERAEVTEEMRRNTNVARGGLPFWRNRDPWKIRTKLNKCATVPLTWAAILTDNRPTVHYSSTRRESQWRADLATAGFHYMWNHQCNGDQVLHDTILVSRVQKVGYISLRPKPITLEPNLIQVNGDQIYVDANAKTIDDAKIIVYEYHEGYGSLCSRFKGLKEKLQRKYDRNNDDDGRDRGGKVQAPPATYQLPTGTTVNTPAYQASPNPPDGAAGSKGIVVREYWTRPDWTIPIKEEQLLATGVPATRPKMFDTKDPAKSEPLHRVVTEGGTIYELPKSIVNVLMKAQAVGGFKVLQDHPALECVMHEKDYLLYPDGRLTVIVDEDIEADERMNPLGYIPFAQVSANRDLGGGYYGPSDVDLIIDVYEALIRFVSLVFNTANLAGNTIWRIPLDAQITNDEITNAPGSIQREDIMCLRYGKREKAPDLPNYIMAVIKFLDDKINDLSGLNDIMLGKMSPKTQVSTETMTMHQEASGVRFRDANSNIARAMKTLGEHYLCFAARFVKEPIMLELKDSVGIPQEIPFVGTYLTDNLLVEAKAGSQQPSSPTQRLQTILNLKNAGVPFDVDTIYEILEEIGTIPSATATVRRIEKLMADESQKWKLVGLPPPPGSKPNKTAGSKNSRKGG